MTKHELVTQEIHYDERTYSLFAVNSLTYLVNMQVITKRVNKAILIWR